ncbi:carbohydrate sulfotransferase 9 [Lingula anatina]|uniref:Carbohydrate sulfotransferase n=1 Tax=Lingula anatina TaxID=7574 RepID=A0A1S3H9F5_LINAN|nr:carbohydrate sulfotransferase 9 [Lingula anatina]|eukprot:XP_013382101.1 carbohydrate sulfotransferase 9 [Lingula anatina]
MRSEIFKLDRLYKKRTERVKEVCDQLYGKDGRPDFFQALKNITLPIQFLIENQFRVLFCQVFKAGSTNIKRIFMQARDSNSEVLNLAEQDPKEAWQEGLDTYKYLTRKTDPRNASRIVSSYKKLLIVRHPFERLVSYYRMSFELHIFENDDVTGASWQVYSSIRKLYKLPPLRRPKPLNFTALIPFKSYVQFIIDYDYHTKLGDWKPIFFKANHWLPISSQCAPCALTYDLIGKVETLDDDIEAITKMLNLSRTIRYPDKLKRKTKGHVREYFKLLTAEQKDRLKDIYDLDLKLFGYDFYPD